MVKVAPRYQQAQQQAGQQSAGKKADGDNVVDADYKIVDDDN